jgi:tripartite-type tricarboxylate transporter receptor subunit TctC
MTPSLNRRTVAAFVATAGLNLSATATAQAGWPSKPIKLLVPYPAGGFPDSLTRQLGAVLSRGLGTPVVVENRPGASGAIGIQAMSMQQYDAHTFVFITSGHVTLTAMSTSFDLLREVKPVTRISNAPYLLVVNAASRFRHLSELLNARTGTATYGSSGLGSPPHMAVEYLMERASGFSPVHVPYKGAIESANAVLGNQIDFTVGVSGALLPLIASGKLRALAVTSPSRVHVLPDTPTVGESGVPGYSFAAWGGFAAHKDALDSLLERANVAMSKAAAADNVKQLLRDTGSILDVSDNPGVFTRSIEIETAKERATVKRLGLSMQK